ncbi:response regulator transcription factor [Nonomuraea soli]|uniref:Two-component system response regulator DesR n=1 Tax=Nonomuraea soli TaxID=1032476 RepID=A0A7W0CPM9_9ACTN|nr:response regulator transcription factor [Nonomuraea soli]MBA2895021.1 two-component system response regulator DesR [Nonomuraea soli]
MTRLPPSDDAPHDAPSGAPHPIRVLLADDQHLVRQAIAALLSFEPDIEVVAEVDRGDLVLDAAAGAQPDVILLDIDMPGRDGLAVAADLRDHPARVLILTTFSRPGYLRRALSAGAAGFVAKNARAEDLAAAIRRVRAGGTVVDPRLAAASRELGDNPLTDRECDVLRAATGGGTIADIARGLFLSEGTTRNYLSSAIGKTGARNRAEAGRIAEERGWL